MKRAKSQNKPALALITLSILTALVSSSPVLALDPSLDISQFAHTAWTFRNGFLNGAVYAIAQTSDGYLWLGTQSGVVRFDGVRAAPLILPTGQELPSTAVGALLAARDGTLWIGTVDGLASWNNGRLTEYPALSHKLFSRSSRIGTEPCGRADWEVRRESSARFGAGARHVMAMTEVSAPQCHRYIKIPPAACG